MNSMVLNYKSAWPWLAISLIFMVSAAGGDLAAAPTGMHVVKVIAQRFSYTPAEIVLKRGQPVVLEFTSLDFVHGFKVPDLNIRADLPPGKPTQIKLQPEQVGRYDFLCDNFCGAGHEEMGGRIVVVD